MRDDLSDVITQFKHSNDLKADEDNTDDLDLNSVEGRYYIPFDSKVWLCVWASELHMGWDHLAVMAMEKVRKHGTTTIEEREPTPLEIRDIIRRFFDEEEDGQIVEFHHREPMPGKPFKHLFKLQNYTLPSPSMEGDLAEWFEGYEGQDTSFAALKLN
jgi:hypothetical protein